MRNRLRLQVDRLGLTCISILLLIGVFSGCRDRKVQQLPSCPPDQKYDGATKQCAPINKNSSQNQNPNTGSCPAGQVRNIVTGACEVDAIAVDCSQNGLVKNPDSSVAQQTPCVEESTAVALCGQVGLSYEVSSGTCVQDTGTSQDPCPGADSVLNPDEGTRDQQTCVTPSEAQSICASIQQTYANGQCVADDPNAVTLPPSNTNTGLPPDQTEQTTTSPIDPNNQTGVPPQQNIPPSDQSTTAGDGSVTDSAGLNCSTDSAIRLDGQTTCCQSILETTGQPQQQSFGLQASDDPSCPSPLEINAAGFRLCSTGFPELISGPDDPVEVFRVQFSTFEDLARECNYVGEFAAPELTEGN